MLSEIPLMNIFTQRILYGLRQLGYLDSNYYKYYKSQKEAIT